MSTKWSLAVLLATATPAAAHDWYPIECCHDMDCAPVDRAEMVPTPMADDGRDPRTVAPPSMSVTTKHGTVIVPGDFPRRESKDHRMHACMVPGSSGKMELLCLFMPPAM